jgi:DNA helicase II / ATP-dependent DNA helicase PcrA
MAIADEVRVSGYLTEDQLRAVESAGHFFLLSCPGSGKTRSAGVRFAHLASQGTRVAGTSYTNVGIEQIRGVVSGDLHYVVPPECFLGTLHRLLLHYCFFPFGHLVMGCSRTPRLLPDQGPGWPEVIFGGNARVRMPISGFHFKPDGSLCVRRKPPKFPYTPERAAAMEQSQARRMKVRVASWGLASFDDSMYWALRVLEEYPRLAAAIARRFEEIIVDEAQDTSELQLAAVEAIWRTGELRSLVMIGDVEQSIYSFQGASPEGCEQLIETAGLETIGLTENHRSSQRICDVTVNFCAREKPDLAVGEHAACEIEPELIIYEAGSPARLMSAFSARIEELGLKEEESVVLGRVSNLVDELNDQVEVVTVARNPLALGRASAALRGAGTLTRHEIEAVDQLIAHCAWERDLADLDRDERRTLRFSTMRLLTSLPELDLDARSWIQGASKALAAELGEICETPSHKAGSAVRSSTAQSSHRASEVFSSPSPRALRAQTVHGVKGESHDAVLVVVDRLRSRGRGAQSALWSRPLLNKELAPQEAEEIRIAFVALTRARRYCALALPDDTDGTLIDAFQAAGFIRRR